MNFYYHICNWLGNKLKKPDKKRTTWSHKQFGKDIICNECGCAHFYHDEPTDKVRVDSFEYLTCAQCGLLRVLTQNIITDWDEFIKDNPPSTNSAAK